MFQQHTRISQTKLADVFSVLLRVLSKLCKICVSASFYTLLTIIVSDYLFRIIESVIQRFSANHMRIYKKDFGRFFNEIARSNLCWNNEVILSEGMQPLLKLCPTSGEIARAIFHLKYMTLGPNQCRSSREFREMSLWLYKGLQLIQFSANTKKVSDILRELFLRFLLQILQNLMHWKDEKVLEMEAIMWNNFHENIFDELFYAIPNLVKVSMHWVFSCSGFFRCSFFE